jgi:hypothetical protein
MARYLDLRYQYAEEAAPSPSSSKNPLEPGDLMGLPPAWKTKLHRAASTADDEAIRKLLAQIEVDHAAISAALAELERDFRFDEIMELTQNATEDTHA